MNNKITMVTSPDDILQDGFRILTYGLTPDQSNLLSTALLKTNKPHIIVYIDNGQNDDQWVLDKKAKSSIIYFNAESFNQTMVGYLAAQPNSYYFGNLPSISNANINKLNSIDAIEKTMED